MRDNWKNIGKYIADMRKYENLTQEDFIEELRNKTGLKLSRNTLSKIENDERSAFSLEFLLSVAKWGDMLVGTILEEHELDDDEHIEID